MIGFTFQITLASQETPVNVPVTARAVVDWERHHKMGVIKGFGGVDQRTEHALWMAWRCMQLAGHTVKPFDDWIDAEDPEVTIIGRSAKSDPLSGGGTPG